MADRKIRVANGTAKRWVHEHARHRGRKCLIWPFARLQNGYGVVRMNGAGSMQIASRAMCEVAHGKPPKPWYEASHSCGNGGCVNPMHLKWKTPSDNRADKNRHGTAIRGSQHSRSKLSEGNVRKIRSLKGLVTQSSLAKRFGVAPSLISKVQNRIEWSWLK
jgi:hypothetical protein